MIEGMAHMKFKTHEIHLALQAMANHNIQNDAEVKAVRYMNSEPKRSEWWHTLRGHAFRDQMVGKIISNRIKGQLLI